MAEATVYHIPVCPFCQRIEILLTLKGVRDQVEFRVIDITKPRPEWLQQKMRGTTALPIMDLSGGRVLKESLVILEYLEDIFPARPVRQRDPYRRAVEGMMVRMESEFVSQGYALLMNQDPALRDAKHQAMLALHAKLNDFLLQHSQSGPYLFEEFGWAETAFTPFFMRFWFLEYFEGFVLPVEPGYARVREWREACLAHPAAQQVTMEQIVKLYYDYARGTKNGVVLPGRSRSSFALEPDWRARPWPPRDKYVRTASDDELGLLACP